MSSSSPKNVPMHILPELQKHLLGINTARTIESEDFDGVALQGAGKAGEFIPNDNKKAVVKVSVGE